MERSTTLAILLGSIITLSIVIVLIISSIKNKQNSAPCEPFLPNTKYSRHQCSDDPRTYLKIYETGNAVCVCK